MYNSSQLKQYEETVVCVEYIVDYKLLAGVLRDEHIHAAQQLLRKQFPNIEGLRDPILP